MKYAHETHKINLSYEIAILKERKARRLAFVGFLQRARSDPRVDRGCAPCAHSHARGTHSHLATSAYAARVPRRPPLHVLSRMYASAARNS
jgi:hypothetical protein